MIYKKVLKEVDLIVRHIDIGMRWKDYLPKWVVEVEAEAEKDTCLICLKKEEKDLMKRKCYGIVN